MQTMKLELALVSSPSGPQLAPQELSIDVPEGAPGSALVEELARRFPGTRFLVAGRPLEFLTAGVTPLLSGLSW